MSDDHMKMLNLTREWLRSLLPHVLSRIDRVGYGQPGAADPRAGTQVAQGGGGSRPPIAESICYFRRLAHWFHPGPTGLYNRSCELR